MMAVKYKEFEQFVQKVSQADVDAFITACVKELAARLLAKVVKRTPVGRPQNLGDRTEKVTGASGKTRVMLTKDGEIYQKYWSGYRGGTLRRGWISQSESEAESSKGGVSAADIQNYLAGATVIRMGDVYRIEIINPVSYAEYVEYGHRQKPGKYVPALGKRLKKAWVPGRFMMTISVAEVEAIKPKLLQKRLDEWVKKELEEDA